MPIELFVCANLQSCDPIVLLLVQTQIRCVIGCMRPTAPASYFYGSVVCIFLQDPMALGNLVQADK